MTINHTITYLINYVIHSVAPASVDVLQLQSSPVREGTSVTLKCDVQGSKPAATIVWYNGSVPIEQAATLDNIQVVEALFTFFIALVESIIIYLFIVIITLSNETRSLDRKFTTKIK